MIQNEAHFLFEECYDVHFAYNEWVRYAASNGKSVADLLLLNWISGINSPVVLSLLNATLKNISTIE